MRIFENPWDIVALAVSAHGKRHSLTGLALMRCWDWFFAWVVGPIWRWWRPPPPAPVIRLLEDAVDQLKMMNEIQQALKKEVASLKSRLEKLEGRSASN